MLDRQTFQIVVENTPLVSIDICLVSDDQILLGQRINEPLRGFWFTPGGRIYKNETWENALVRIAKVELGLPDLRVERFSLMGVWDHFYNNSAFDKNTTTHYVNLPHYIDVKYKPEIIIDCQHCDFQWFNLSVVANDVQFHPYMRNYARWLLNKMGTCI